MNDAIYKSDSFGDFNIVVEGDKHSIWAYVFEQVKDEYELLCDGFVCSRGLVIETNEDVKSFIEKGFQPPLMQEYATENAVQKNLTSRDITISITTQEIIIEIKSISYLKIAFDNLKPLSKAVSKDGPYGFSWKESLN